MRDLGKLLNLAVAIVLAALCFGYAFTALGSGAVDPRPSLERAAKGSAYLAGAGGVFALAFVAQSLDGLGYPLFLRWYQIAASAALAIGALWAAFRLAALSPLLSIANAAALLSACIGLGALLLTARLVKPRA